MISLIRLFTLSGSLLGLVFAALVVTALPACQPTLGGSGGGGDEDDPLDDDGTCTPDEFEDNDTRADSATAATAQSEDDETLRNDLTLCAGGDVDWFVAEVPVNWVNHYRVASDDIEEVYLSLFDADGELIEEAEVGSDGFLRLEVDNYDGCPTWDDDDDDDDDDEGDGGGSPMLVQFLQLVGADPTASIEYELHAGSTYICGWE